ncbi:hypothetical protein IEO21_01410 [Rhodonia placenta]|uniref:Polysaccharide lyase 14 domain-containing protein n=1 Tax=Rhodonia placenta TaxID=104341 RepID=A0A8H7U5W5_9APHY|nr:hypothetical protein IEO21_01410 [Postia placenta]
MICTSSLLSSQIVLPAALASEYSLTTSTSLPFPTSTLSSEDAQSFLVSSWSLSKGRVQDGAEDLSFVSDPYANGSSSSMTTAVSAASSSPVLQVTYPAGSYSHDTGGAQLYALWNASGSAQFQSMLVTYEIAFESDFDWVKGGKLPGLRGGPDPDGCSGGSPANGSNCFSTRPMWRKQGEGEVYAYFLEPQNLCTNSNFRCNSEDYGTSIDRGSFTFQAGQWSQITMLVRLNDPPEAANGQVALYDNNVKAVDQRNLQYRSNLDVNIGGLYFSNTSWATPETVHTYFRNFQIWASTAPSNITAATAQSPSLGRAFGGSAGLQSRAAPEAGSGLGSG